MSCILANNNVMSVYKPGTLIFVYFFHFFSNSEIGTHGSTFGGNPLSSAVAIASLQVLKDENLAENALILGDIFRKELTKLQSKYPFIKQVRGKGLLNAVVMDPNYKRSAWDLCILFKEKGLLAKPTHGHIIRFAPPLVMTEEQIHECVKIIGDSVKELSE